MKRKIVSLQKKLERRDKKRNEPVFITPKLKDDALTKHIQISPEVRKILSFSAVINT